MKCGWIFVWMLSVASVLAEPVSIPLEGATDGVWKVEHTEAAKKTFAVAAVLNPVVGDDHYAVVGEVRYQGVQGESFLEMLNHFGESSFFSRTLADMGPMKTIAGDSEWRAFALPFNKNDEMDPDKLVINLVLEGQGAVELRNLRLVAGSGWMGSLQHPGAWWAPRTSGLIGAALGMSAGLLGALIGFCRKSARWHRAASGLSMLLLATGVASLFGLVAALITHQPGYVFWLFLLFGIIGTWVGADSLRQLRKERTEHELRRMDAADATRRGVKA